MRKRKVIEDSDGEDDEPGSSPLLAPSILRDLSPGNVVGFHDPHATHNSHSVQTSGSSTASAEHLNREIQNAQRSLMESTPIGSTISTGRYSYTEAFSPLPNTSKRIMKRALSHAEMASPGSHKAPRRKGSSASRESYGNRGSSDGELDMSSRAAKPKGKGTGTKNDVEGTEPVTVDMQPRMKRQRMGDQAKSSGLTPDSIITESTPAKAISSHGTPAGSSICGLLDSFKTPTDGCMPPPSVSTRGRSDNADTTPEDQPQVNLRSSAIAALQPLPGSGSEQEPSSSASVISPSKTITVERGTVKQVRLQSEDSEDELSLVTPISYTAGSNNPIVLLPPQANDESRSDGINNTTKVVKDVSPDLVSDDIAVGMPKEQYRPRPSRSRANAEDLVAPVDFSKRPEAVAKTTVKPKRKNKRCKTTCFEELRPAKDEMEEDDEMREQSKELDIPIWKDSMFEPQLDIGIKDAKDDKSVAIDNETSTEPEAAILRPKKQRGRPKKTHSAGRDEPSTKAIEGTDKGECSVSELSSVRAAKPASNEDVALELQTDCKDAKGRKRPGDPKDKNDSREEPTTGEKALEESAGNASKLVSPSVEKMASPETPEKSTEAPDRGAEKHSPISSGKVGYRVGLSKRARIEPLLRIVRK